MVMISYTGSLEDEKALEAFPVFYGNLSKYLEKNEDETVRQIVSDMELLTTAEEKTKFIQAIDYGNKGYFQAIMEENYAFIALSCHTITCYKENLESYCRAGKEIDDMLDFIQNEEDVWFEIESKNNKVLMKKSILDKKAATLFNGFAYMFSQYAEESMDESLVSIANKLNKFDGKEKTRYMRFLYDSWQEYFNDVIRGEYKLISYAKDIHKAYKVYKKISKRTDLFD